MVLATLISIPIFIAGLGAFTLVRGVRPGRLGDERRCRRCDYELQGIDSPHCPECGLPLSSANVVHGRRYRRPWLAVAGVVGLLIGLGVIGALGYVQVQQINWISFRPTSWLIDDLSSTAASTQQDSWHELDRRISGVGISQRQTDRLVDFCLAMQMQNSPVPSIFGDMADVVARELLAGKLTDKRRNAFLSHLMRLSLAVRPKANGTLPYSIAEESRGPNHQPFWYSEKTVSTRIDGRLIDRADEESMSGQMSGNAGGGIGGSVDLNAAHVSPGRHVLQMQCRLRFHPGNPDWSAGDSASVLMQTAADISRHFEALPASTLDPVESIRDPTLMPVLRSAVKIADVRLSNGYLFLRVEAQSPPTDLCFQVFAVVGKLESLITSVSFHKGGYGSYGTGGPLPTHTQLVGNAIDLVLRSSSNVARKTIDIKQIWDGELTFRDVPFVRSAN